MVFIATLGAISRAPQKVKSFSASPPTPVVETKLKHQLVKKGGEVLELCSRK